MAHTAPRGWLGTIADRLYSWQNSLPPERSGSNYTITTNIRIPVDSAAGTTLAANLYLTLTSPPLGTLLIRTPYGLGLADALSTARFFAARGYHVLHNACRGTSGSDGILLPAANDIADGHAVVEWMRAQAWYTGSFGTLGGSYLGYTQWALLTDPPHDMKAAAVFTGPLNFHDFTWGRTGCMNPHIVAWADVTNRMNRNVGIVGLLLFIRTISTRYKETLDSVPLLGAVDKYFEGKSPAWLRDVIKSPNASDAYWQSVDRCDAGVLERINIPVLLVTGWYDIILDSVLEQYKALARRGTTVRLVIGPWTHLAAQGRNVPAETLPWMDEHLAGRKPDSERAAVRFYMTGKKEWRELSHWPPEPSSNHELFLNSDKTLSSAKPTSTDAKSSFIFDPTNPTPCIGASLPFTAEMGTTDQNNTLISRPDVLTWTSPPLETDLEVCGKPFVDLFHSTDPPYADILVILSEVDACGVSRQVSERIQRLDPDRNRAGIKEPLHLSLNDIAHVFLAGNKIRLSIAGGSHPRFVRNLGSGEDQATGTTFRCVTHTVEHHAGAVSRLSLPVTSSSAAL